MTCRTGHLRVKKKAARRSSDRKKMLLHSLHHHVKIERSLLRWRVGTKTGLRLRDWLQ